MNARKPPSPTEIAVDAALARFGIKFSIEGGQLGMRDTWACYSWRATFATAPGHGPRNKLYTCDYFTGTGIATKSKYLNGAGRWSEPQPFIPSAADVLHSLLSDSHALELSFPDWCDEYGSDSDSLKALRVYQTCCDIGAALRKLFTREQREELAALLQDY